MTRRGTLALLRLEQNFPKHMWPPVSGGLGVGYRLSACATNPSFGEFLNYLHIRVTGVCKEFAMLINTQE